MSVADDHETALSTFFQASRKCELSRTKLRSIGRWIHRREVDGYWLTKCWTWPTRTNKSTTSAWPTSSVAFTRLALVSSLYCKKLGFLTWKPKPKHCSIESIRYVLSCLISPAPIFYVWYRRFLPSLDGSFCMTLNFGSQKHCLRYHNRCLATMRRQCSFQAARQKVIKMWEW